MRKSTSLLALFIFLAACKDGPAIGKGFILDTPAAIFAKADKLSKQIKALDILSEVEILKFQVPDKKNDKLFWFKVRQADAVGYISYDEEILKKNFVSVKPEAQGHKAVFISDLNIRQKPSKKANSVAILKKGTVVDIVSEGSLRVTIDGITENWAEVKTEDNKTGYVFAGYIRRGTAADFDSKEKIAKVLEAAEKGWALILTDKKYPVTDMQGQMCMSSAEGRLPKKGDIVEIRGKKTENGKSFYLIGDQLDAINACEWGWEQWIPTNEIQYIPSLYEHTKPMNTAVAPELLDFLNANLNGVMDARSVEVKQIKLRNEPGVEFLQVIAREGVSSSRGRVGNAPQIIFATKQAEKYSLIGKFDNATLTDIDGDGTMELTTDVSMRESVPLHVYSYISGTGFKQIFELNEAYGATSVIDSPHLIIESYSEIRSDASKFLNPKFASQRIHAFKLAKGKFSEVALPAKYQQKEKELNAEQNKQM